MGSKKRTALREPDEDEDEVVAEAAELADEDEEEGLTPTLRALYRPVVPVLLSGFDPKIVLPTHAERHAEWKAARAKERAERSAAGPGRPRSEVAKSKR